VRDSHADVIRLERALDGGEVADLRGELNLFAMGLAVRACQCSNLVLNRTEQTIELQEASEHAANAVAAKAERAAPCSVSASRTAPLAASKAARRWSRIPRVISVLVFVVFIVPSFTSISPR
jgi:hypothetical protein